MSFALDTNVLAYAEGVNGAPMRRKALRILDALPPDQLAIPVQALGELFNVLVKKARWRPSRAGAAVLAWRDAYPAVDTSSEILVSAFDLAADHGFGIWDSIIICAAAAANCRLLLTEDLQEGFTWRGVTVVNPFAPTPHPLLSAALDR